MKHYNHLTQEQRYGIYTLLKTGHNNSEIASTIGVYNSTISRELKRNRGKRGYRYKQAHRKAIGRRTAKGRPLIDSSTWTRIDSFIRNYWSPEQISGRMKREYNISVSHEWIYQHILQNKRQGGILYLHLRCKKKRKKRYGSDDRRGQIKNRLSIDERPKVVDSRNRIGDWEADTIIGKQHQQALVSVVERKTKYTLIRKTKRKTKDQVSQALIDLLRLFKARVLTITPDNGKEFAGHVEVSQALGTTFYFAHPYSAWERGTNENTNGLIRQYFPKQRNFTTITDEEVNSVMERLNNRPRKCLGFQTPNEVFLTNDTVALTT